MPGSGAWWRWQRQGSSRATGQHPWPNRSAQTWADGRRAGCQSHLSHLIVTAQRPMLSCIKDLAVGGHRKHGGLAAATLARMQGCMCVLVYSVRVCIIPYACFALGLETQDLGTRWLLPCQYIRRLVNGENWPSETNGCQSLRLPYMHL